MTAIAIGSAAIDRASFTSTGRTIINLNSSADGTGTIDTINFWFDGLGGGASGVKAGTFSGSGTSYDDRDFETIGNVTEGSAQSFTGLNCDVVTGDFIGLYATAGDIERANSGTSYGIYAGDAFGQGSLTYTVTATRIISLGGSGTTGAAGWANKFNGVANASIAKINGIAIASIAKVNGI